MSKRSKLSRKQRRQADQFGGSDESQWGGYSSGQDATDHYSGKGSHLARGRFHNPNKERFIKKHGLKLVLLIPPAMAAVSYYIANMSYHFHDFRDGIVNAIDPVNETTEQPNPIEDIHLLENNQKHLT